MMSVMVSSATGLYYRYTNLEIPEKEESAETISE
jgi:hypothetical protein